MSRLLIPLLVFFSAAAPASAQSRKPIEAQDGDVILLRDTTRVRIVRRAEGNVRTIYNASQRWLIVLLDHAKAGTPPDGRVDVTYDFSDVEGEWPLGERWDGYATLDDYSVAGEMGNAGIGLTTPGGLVQIVAGPRGPRGLQAPFRDPTAVATLTISGAGRGGGGNATFDRAEQQEVGVAMRNATGTPPPGFRTGVSMTIEGGATIASSAAGTSPAPTAPVRVGGNIAAPRKIQDAQPVTSELARQANVQGTVVLEIVIGPDGMVSDARILRSIPLLDQAAIDAVRKWRYTPTLLNGMPVAVIMTATVSFP
jgi:TonB family protein